MLSSSLATWSFLSTFSTLSVTACNCWSGSASLVRAVVGRFSSLGCCWYFFLSWLASLVSDIFSRAAIIFIQDGLSSFLNHTSSITILLRPVFWWLLSISLISLWLSPRYVPSVSHSTFLSSCKRRSTLSCVSDIASAVSRCNRERWGWWALGIQLATKFFSRCHYQLWSRATFCMLDVTGHGTSIVCVSFPLWYKHN